MSSERRRFEFRMPDPGEGLTEAELDAWLVAAGDEVREDDVLCEVETDKAIVEIPVPCSGEVLELRADPGDVVAVGDVIAVFETADPPSGQAPAATGADATTGTPTGDAGGAGAGSEAGSGDAAADGVESAVTPVEGSNADATGGGEGGDAGTDAPSTSDGRAFAAPSTRRYAREQGVDIAALDGSGPGGRVLRSDVDAHTSRASSPSPSDVESSAAIASGADSDAPAGRDTDSADRTGADGHAADSDDRGDVVRRPLRGLRATIAENMVESKRTIPHVTSAFEADASDLVALRERLDGKLDVRVTYTALVIKAVVSGLDAYPALNASIDEEAGEIVEKRYYDLGVATHTDDGLVVPVVEDVDRLSIADLNAEIADLVERARERSLAPEELRGGTFTVTNTGSHSEHGTFGTPIIRHPEVAILGMGRIRNEPVAVDDAVEVRPVMPLSLSYDHRLVDGVTAAQFAEHVIEAIEDADVLVSRL